MPNGKPPLLGFAVFHIGHREQVRVEETVEANSKGHAMLACVRIRFDLVPFELERLLIHHSLIPRRPKAATGVETLFPKLARRGPGFAPLALDIYVRPDTTDRPGSCF